MNASRTDSRDSAITDGSDGSSPATSGSGSSHATSCRSDSSPMGSAAGWPSPVGNGRRLRPSSAVRHVLVAIRYSHVRTEDFPSKPR